MVGEKLLQVLNLLSSEGMRMVSMLIPASSCQRSSCRTTQQILVLLTGYRSGSVQYFLCDLLVSSPSSWPCTRRHRSPCRCEHLGYRTGLPEPQAWMF